MDQNIERIRDIYRAVVADAGVESIQRKQAIAQVVEQCQALVRSGELTPDLYTWVSSVVVKVDESDGAKADHILAAIARGEDDLGLEADPILDLVVTLGRGRRKIWRFVSLLDLDEMDELRNNNVRSVAIAYRDEWKPQYDAWRRILRRNITIGAAVEQGDLPDVAAALFEAG